MKLTHSLLVLVAHKRTYYGTIEDHPQAILACLGRDIDVQSWNVEPCSLSHLYAINVDCCEARPLIMQLHMVPFWPVMMSVQSLQTCKATAIVFFSLKNGYRKIHGPRTCGRPDAAGFFPVDSEMMLQAWPQYLVLYSTLLGIVCRNESGHTFGRNSAHWADWLSMSLDYQGP